MPFGLKNTGATYHKTTTGMLPVLICKEIEVHVDDMMAKSPTRKGHFEALGKFLERAEKYNLRLNPKKCVFEVTSRKLLGHIMSQKGIEVDPDKVKAIREMPPPKNEKEVWGFIGRLQYISRFIAKFATICEPQANSAIEATNKNVKRILFKMLKNYQDWSEYLQFTLWGYRTIARTSTGVTPYSLVYSFEALLPIEIEV